MKSTDLYEFEPIQNGLNGINAYNIRLTSFEIQPAAGVKVSRISNLAKDLARSLAVVSVRVVEVIPGKSFVGLEIPNESREMGSILFMSGQNIRYGYQRKQ